MANLFASEYIHMGDLELILAVGEALKALYNFFSLGMSKVLLFYSSSSSSVKLRNVHMTDSFHEDRSLSVQGQTSSSP